MISKSLEAMLDPTKIKACKSNKFVSDIYLINHHCNVVDLSNLAFSGTKKMLSKESTKIVISIV